MAYGNQPPYVHPVGVQQQQLPTAVQPIIINTSEPQQTKKVIVEQPKAHRGNSNDFYDVDGFYDAYSGNFNGGK